MSFRATAMGATIFRLPCDEPVEKGLDHGIVLRGDHCAHEEECAHGAGRAADEALAAPLAMLHL